MAVAGLVLGAAVAVVVAAARDGGEDGRDVIAALASRLGPDVDAPCVYGHLVAAGAGPDDAAAVATATARCTRSGAATPTSTTPATDPGAAPGPAGPATTARPPVDPDTCAGDPDDPMVDVCLEELLADHLQAGAGLDGPAAHCAADSLVETLGRAELQSLLAGRPPSASTTDAVREALAAC